MAGRGGLRYMHVFLLTLLTVLRLCAGEPAEITVAVSRTPSALPVLRMLETGQPEGTAIRLAVWTGPEQLIALVQDKRHHMFSLPVTVAARLSVRGADVRLTNINSWDGIRLLSSDPAVQSWADLKGRTVYVPQRTSPPDLLTRLFLRHAGLEPGRDVTLVYAPAAEIAQLMRIGRIGTAVLLEPRASAVLLEKENVRTVFRYGDEWKAFCGDDAAMLPSIGFGGAGWFVDAHPELTARFEAAYAEAAEWIVSHPVEAGWLAERHLGLDAAAVTLAMPELGLLYRSAAEARPDLVRLLKALEPFSPAGKDELPDEIFYWR